MSCPHPTPQYGQIERATSASSMRACIARVFSDIASRPVPSLRSRIWRTSGHFESQANMLSISLHFAAADNPGFNKMVAASSAALVQLAREFEAGERRHLNVDVLRKRQHLKSTAQHFRMKQRLQFALGFRAIG